MEDLMRAHVKVTAMDAAIALYCCHHGAGVPGPGPGGVENEEIDWGKLMDIFHEIGVLLDLKAVGIDIG